MICFPCTKGNHDYCRNKTHKDGSLRPVEIKTQCSCQHLETGMIDSTQCKHLNIVEATRYCAQCRKSIPLTMTKSQAIAMLNDFVDDLSAQVEKEDKAEIVSGYAERFLNDRPTKSRSEAETSISQM